MKNLGRSHKFECFCGVKGKEFDTKALKKKETLKGEQSNKDSPAKSSSEWRNSQLEGYSKSCTSHDTYRAGKAACCVSFHPVYLHYVAKYWKFIIAWDVFTITVSFLFPPGRLSYTYI